MPYGHLLVSTSRPLETPPTLKDAKHNLDLKHLERTSCMVLPFHFFLGCVATLAFPTLEAYMTPRDSPEVGGYVADLLFCLPCYQPPGLVLNVILPSFSVSSL